jgi:hypothetical protein
MRPKFLIFLVLAFFAYFAHADNAITFSSGLPKPWVQLSSQTLPGTNTVTHETFGANITVLQDPSNLTTMMISVAPAAAAQTTNNLTVEAGNWVHSVLSRFGENLNFTISRLDIKTENKRTFAETAFTIQLQDASMFGISRYEIANTNVISWVAFGAKEGIETNKTVLKIAGSIRVRR